MPDLFTGACRSAWRARAGTVARALGTPGALAALLVANLLVGPTFAFGGLYAITACLAAWMLGLAPALLLGLAAIGGSVAINGVGGPYGGPPLEADLAGAVLAVGLRALSLFAAVVLIVRLRGRYDTVCREADRDPLTGLHNHRAFHDELDMAVARAARRGETIALAYIDLDDFKGINDRLGHRAGDRVLRSFACAARQALRRGDCIGRLGGDEFAILITVTDAAAAPAVVRSVHARIVDTLAPQGERLSFSMGAVHVRPHREDDAARLIDAADRLMYRAKSGAKGGLLVAAMEVTGAPRSAAAPRTLAALPASLSPAV